MFSIWSCFGKLNMCEGLFSTTEHTSDVQVHLSRSHCSSTIADAAEIISFVVSNNWINPQKTSDLIWWLGYRFFSICWKSYWSIFVPCYLLVSISPATALENNHWWNIYKFWKWLMSDFWCNYYKTTITTNITLKLANHNFPFIIHW